MLGRTDLKDMLKTGIYTVTFTKKNGEERIMRCTLNPAYLPLQESSQLLTEVPENQSILRVWDLDVNAWRTFRMDSISLVY